MRVRMMARDERKGFPGVKRNGTFPLGPSKLAVALIFTKVRHTRRESPVFHTETFLRLVGEAGVFTGSIHHVREAQKVHCYILSRRTDISILFLTTGYKATMSAKFAEPSEVPRVQNTLASGQ